MKKNAEKEMEEKKEKRNQEMRRNRRRGGGEGREGRRGGEGQTEGGARGFKRSGARPSRCRRRCYVPAIFLALLRVFFR